MQSTPVDGAPVEDAEVDEAEVVAELEELGAEVEVEVEVGILDDGELGTESPPHALTVSELAQRAPDLHPA